MRSFKADALTTLARMLSDKLEMSMLSQSDGTSRVKFTTEERMIMECILAIGSIPEELPNE